MFSIIKTRQDIVFVNSVTSHFEKNSSHKFIKAIKIMLQYLKSLKKHKIINSCQNKLLIEGYFDSEWAVNKKSQKSNLSYIFIFNGEMVRWYVKRQTTISLSFIKIKYITLTLAAKEVIWLQLLFKYLTSYNPTNNTFLLSSLKASLAFKAFKIM